MKYLTYTSVACERFEESPAVEDSSELHDLTTSRPSTPANIDEEG